MDYFTEEVIHWDASPQLCRAACAAYRAHLARLWPQLPPSLRALSEIDLQDGLVRQVVLDRNTETILLRLRCGCFQDPQGTPVGYFDLDLQYRQVILMPTDLEALQKAAQDRVEVLHDELDREAEGVFVHRLLCTGFDDAKAREVIIRFRELALFRTPREQRRGKVGWPRKRYVEISPGGAKLDS